MKQLPIILSALALLGVIALLIMYSNMRKNFGPTNRVAVTTSDSTDQPQTHVIGYFQMDSIDQKYTYLGQVRDQMKRNEANASSELENLKKNAVNRVAQLEKRAPTMSQQEFESAQKEIQQLQVNIQQREMKLSQDLQEKQLRLMKDVNNEIESFLKEYNKDGRFQFIFSKGGGDQIYFADSTLDITNDVLAGLNARHESKQKKD